MGLCIRCRFLLTALHGWTVIRIEFCLFCILLRCTNFSSILGLWCLWSYGYSLSGAILGPVFGVRTSREIRSRLIVVSNHLYSESILHPLSTFSPIFARKVVSFWALLSFYQFLISHSLYIFCAYLTSLFECKHWSASIYQLSW